MQWLARLDCTLGMAVRHKFEHYQMFLLFHWARNVTLLSQYLLISRTYLQKKIKLK